MMKKIIGFIICTLLIVSAVYPVIGNVNIVNHVKSKAEDTWSYDYATNTWTNMTALGSYSEVDGPLPSLQQHAMVYDPDADLTLMFGGMLSSGVCSNDTWSYDYTTNIWTKMNALGSYGEVDGTLSPRACMKMVYDSSAQRVIMFSGASNDGFFNDTWTYDASTNTWTNMSPATVGGTLNCTGYYGLAYDSVADRTIRFGGGQVVDAWTNETWTYDYNDNKWYKMNPEIVGGTLFGRWGTTMVYDSNADRTILFGGQKEAGSVQLNDTWVYNYTDTRWCKASYNVIGGTLWRRECADMVYDSTHKRIVLFAGFTNDILPGEMLNDTWILKYNIGNEPPNPPSNPVPANGSINVGIDADLSWYCWDPDLDDLTYDVYFEANDSTPDVKVSSNQTETVYDSGTMEFDTTYYWQIVAWDTEGHSTAGPIWHFTTRGNNPPNTPSDPEPEDGETGVYINTDLGWTGGDPDGDEVTYDVYFGKSSPPPLIESNQSGTTYNPGLLDFETEYFWQIVAWDEFENSAVGPIWSFTTEENLPPYEPSDPNPPDGATDVTIYKILSWTGGDPNIGDPVIYDVYLGDSSPPPLVAEDLTYEAYDPGTMELGTTYYWQIISEDSGGLTTEGPIWSFTTEEEPNEPPTAPDIDGPSKGKPGKEICWTFHSDDPNDDDVKYIIDWGDENSEETDYYPSCTPAEACHTYDEEGTYIIKAMAEDIKEARSDESTFEVEIPRTRATYYTLFYWLLERFPLLERLLNLLN